jgi:mannose-6-phosphate isomerase-like protein (cupin superfamily)
MSRHLIAPLALSLLTAVAVAQTPSPAPQQTPPVTGDRSTPLRPLAGEGNVGISNATLRDQPEVRALRVVVEAGGVRAVHAHADVRFHLFVPISGVMQLDLEGSGTTEVQPWHPYFMQGGTSHGFRNAGPEAVEIMEIFIR